MRTLCVLFLVILPAGCVFAQEVTSQVAPSGKFFGPFASGNVPFVQPIVPSATKVSVALATPVKTCSVPLVKMRIPKDVTFSMPVIVPLAEVEKIPQAKVPAPSCDSVEP